MPQSVDEWARYDDRLYTVTQALYYVVEMVGQRVRSDGPYLTRSTLRGRDTHSSGARRSGLLESHADTSHRRGSVSRPSITRPDDEFGLRRAGETLERFEAVAVHDGTAEKEARRRRIMTDGTRGGGGVDGDEGEDVDESALQAYADLLMDECFLSVYVAFVHLKRSNSYLSSLIFL